MAELAARSFASAGPVEEIPPEPTLSSLDVPPERRGDWLANATMATGVAVVIAVLVVVAIVGVVGGLGLGIAIANVVG